MSEKVIYNIDYYNQERKTSLSFELDEFGDLNDDMAKAGFPNCKKIDFWQPHDDFDIWIFYKEFNKYPQIVHCMDDSGLFKFIVENQIEKLELIERLVSLMKNYISICKDLKIRCEE